MEDGKGRLADGTVYERTSGEELGKDGYWFRWTRLRGISPRGKVHCCRLFAETMCCTDIGCPFCWHHLPGISPLRKVSCCRLLTETQGSLALASE